MKRGFLLFVCAFALLESAAGYAGPFLYSYFTGNGEDGLHLAYSRNGYTWKSLNGGKSFLSPKVGGKLMRDPCIRQGPDGRFHMVWTTSWNDDGFGYAHSDDLIHWSAQKYVNVVPKEEGAKNVWAPDLFYDAATQKYLIVWATTFEGRYPDQAVDEGKWNHRQYYVSTTDFAGFSETKLFLDPGFNCIDGTLVLQGSTYHFIFKDERPGQKTLRVCTSESVEGPWGDPSEPLGGDWVEGPSPLRIGEDLLVYFDHYTKPQYIGAYKTHDLIHWEEVSDQVRFPEGVRHGTAFSVEEKILDVLLTR